MIYCERLYDAIASATPKLLDQDEGVKLVLKPGPCWLRSYELKDMFKRLNLLIILPLLSLDLEGRPDTRPDKIGVWEDTST